nr:hypothetical protein [Tanacetum cinerariifolium]
MVEFDIGQEDDQAPRNHIGGADAQTRFETTSKRSSDLPLSTSHTIRSREDMMEQETNLTNFVPPTPHDSPLSEGHTPKSDKGRPNLIELMNICTQLSNKVLALEEAKTIQAKVITRLKLRVRRLEKKRKARTSQPMKRRLFKGRTETSNDKSLGGSTADQVSIARPKVSAATLSTPPTTTTIFVDEDLTIAQTLIKMKTKMDVDHELVVRMTHEEKDMYTIKERARFLVEYFKRIKKHLAAKRAKAIRNKPPTRTQVRNKMVTYLKHMVVSDEEETVDPEILSTKERYPLIKEMLEKMLNWKLKAEAESTMAYELLKFIKSHIEE